MNILKIPRLGKSDISLFLLALLFSTFIPIIPNWNFFFGHVFFALWCLLILITSISRNKNTPLYLIIAATIILGTLYLFHLFGKGSEHRFSQDSAKTAFIILTLICVTTAATRHHSITLLRNFIFIFPFVFSLQFLVFKEDDWFGYSGRLYDELFGSPNTVSTFCGLAVLTIISNKKEFPHRAWNSVLLLFYITVIIFSFSRSAIIATSIASLIIIINKRAKAAIGALIVLIASSYYFVEINSNALPDWVFDKSNLANDLKETGGSGRLHLWSISVGQIFSDISTLIAGQGPGRVIEYMDYDKIADHPHNFYIFIALAFGLPALIAFIIGWLHCLLRAYKLFRIDQKYSITLFSFYTISFFFDTHIISSQFIIPHILALSILIGEHTRNNQHKLASEIDSLQLHRSSTR